MLKLHVVVNITAGSYYTFAFDVQNPLCGQPAQPVCIRAKGFCTGKSCRHKELIIPRRLMEHDKSKFDTSCGAMQGYKAPLQVVQPTITLASLEHTSPWASETNNLTLRLRTNVPLLTKVSPKLTIYLSQQHGSQTPAGSLDMTFAGQQTTGTWNPVTGTLEMLLPIDTVACETYNITFSLKNRACQHNAPTTYVEITSGSVCSIARNMWTSPDADPGVCFERKEITPVPLQTCGLSASPLQVHGGPCNNEAATATFTQKRVYQSSCLPGCNNTITVELMANVPIPAHQDQKIVLDFYLPEDVCIAQYNVKPHFMPSWSERKLILTVEQSMEACTYYNITFTVTNDMIETRLADLQSPTVMATGAVTIPKIGRAHV